MVISKIEHNGFLYFDVHAEQSYTGSFLADTGDANNNICEGIYGSELTAETLRNITDEVALYKGKTIVLDFSKIKDVQSNLFNTLIEIKEHSELLVLTGVSAHIVKKCNLGIFEQNKPGEGGNFESFILTRNIPHITLKDTNELFYEHFSTLLVDCTITNEGEDAFRHNSPVYVPKFIDIKGMMTNDSNFYLYILYRLALSIKEKFAEDGSGVQPILFCQNLNGAYNAAILSRFLNYDLLSMDHIGPVNKVYSSIGNKIKEEARYIVISDVVCLGTEIKICQNIINYSGGRYIGNASIVKIETLKKEHQDNDSVSVFKITRENNPIEFKIVTALA
jgi:hypothetical protein